MSAPAVESAHDSVLALLQLEAVADVQVVSQFGAEVCAGERQLVLAETFEDLMSTFTGQLPWAAGANTPTRAAGRPERELGNWRTGDVATRNRPRF